MTAAQLGIAAILVIAPCSCHSDDAAAKRAAPDTAPVAVSTVIAQHAERLAAAERSGVLQPGRRAVLASKLAARIHALAADEGQRVAGGAVVVQLDARDLAARRAQLRASRASADAQARWSGKELERTRALGETGAVAGANVDDAARAQAVSEASLAGVDAQLRELDTSLAEAEIRAPFPGVVVRRTAEVGQLAMPGQPLLVLEDDSTLRVTMSLGESEGRKVHEGERITVRSDDAAVAGTVTAIVSAGDSAAPGLRLIVALDNARRALRAGTIARIELPLDRPVHDVVAVPTSAIRYRGSLPGVWVVRGDRLVFAWVRIVQGSELTTWIGAGIDAGDRVARTASDPGLHDGLPVVPAR